MRCRWCALAHWQRVLVLLAFLAGCVAEEDTVAIIRNSTPTNIPTVVRSDASSPGEPSDEAADATAPMSDASDEEASAAAADAGGALEDGSPNEGAELEADAPPTGDAGDPDSAGRAYYFPIIFPWLIHQPRDN